MNSTSKSMLGLLMTALFLTAALVCPAPALAGPQPVPLKGSLQAFEAYDLQFPTLFVDAIGSGTSTHLGRFTVAYQVDVNLLTGEGLRLFIWSQLMETRSSQQGWDKAVRQRTRMSVLLWRRTPLQAVRVDSKKPPGVSPWSAWLTWSPEPPPVRSTGPSRFTSEVIFAIARHRAASGMPPLLFLETHR